MFAFIISRILQALPVMLTVALISFAMFAYVGDPVAIMLVEHAGQLLLGRHIHLRLSHGLYAGLEMWGGGMNCRA